MDAAETAWLSTSGVRSGAAAVKSRGCYQCAWMQECQWTVDDERLTSGRIQQENAAAAEESTRKCRRCIPAGVMGKDSTAVKAAHITSCICTAIQ
jgi:hypothetical protein